MRRALLPLLLAVLGLAGAGLATHSLHRAASSCQFSCVALKRPKTAAASRAMDENWSAISAVESVV